MSKSTWLMLAVFGIPLLSWLLFGVAPSGAP